MELVRRRDGPTLSKQSGQYHNFHQQPSTAFSTLSLLVSSNTHLLALTERQLQFWNDVEEGLDGIEKYYHKKTNQGGIDRVRDFAKRARGELPLVSGYAPGHEPSEEHIDGLTAKSFWDIYATTIRKEEDSDEERPKDDDDGAESLLLFPWASKLEENALMIIQEFQEKLIRQPQEMFRSDSVWQNQVMGQGWSAIRLQRLGKWNVDVCQTFPKTYQLLQELDIPLAVRGVCFAKQSPNSGVQPHSDGRNFILTAHLGIQIPTTRTPRKKDDQNYSKSIDDDVDDDEDDDDERNKISGHVCWIRVGNEYRTWQEGKVLILDTSFSHSTGNDSSTEDRYVLILDFWHPELTLAERAALSFIYDLRNHYDADQNGVFFRQPTGTTKKPQRQGGIGGLWWNSRWFGADGGNTDNVK